ncbi:MAG TPA: hypothetical protein PKX69_07810, partial [Limnochordia bacterium]|nr:hypothetical protein [Limnochordia bacterium]HPP71682.1 hypothetical protein [Limnochordia bacterium]HPU65626.1 hypothetical protein [Limnochordia bacterium]
MGSAYAGASALVELLLGFRPLLEQGFQLCASAHLVAGVLPPPLAPLLERAKRAVQPRSDRLWALPRIHWQKWSSLALAALLRLA